MPAGQIQLLPEVYKILITAIHDEFSKEWQEGSKTKRRPIPEFTSTRFYMHLETYLRSNKTCATYTELNKVSVNSKDFIYQRQRTLQANGEWKTVKYNKLKLYLLYLGYESLEQFLDDEQYFNNDKLNKLRKTQLAILSGISGLTKEKPNIISYYFYTFHTLEISLAGYLLEIDFTKAKRKNASRNAKLYNLRNPDKKVEIGTAIFKMQHLHVSFDREEKSSDMWMPLSLYFHIHKKADISQIPVLAGTYAGVSKYSYNALAGEVILCQKEIAENNERIVAAIAKRLYLNQHEISVSTDPSAQTIGLEGAIGTIRNIESGSATILKNLIGNYEAISLYSDKRGIYRFHVVMNEDYTIQLLERDSSYWGKIEVVNNSVFVHFRRQKNKDVRKEGLDYLDHFIVINSKPVIVFNNKCKVLQASFAGRTSNKSAESFYIYLLKVNDLLPIRQYQPKEFDTFIEERDEYKIILQKMIDETKDKWLGMNLIQEVLDSKNNELLD